MDGLGILAAVWATLGFVSNLFWAAELGGYGAPSALLQPLLAVGGDNRSERLWHAPRRVPRRVHGQSKQPQRRCHLGYWILGFGFRVSG